VADEYGGDATPLESGVPGVLHFPEAFERVIDQLRRGLTEVTRSEPLRKLAFAPVVSRRTIERAGYLSGFPHLLGSVHSYTGGQERWEQLEPLVVPGGDWHADQRISDLVLPPAACYPVYATLSGRDLDAPARFAVEAHCFRQEGTSEPGRLRSFRMLELVIAATAPYCVEWRQRWLDRIAGWLAAMSLDVSVETVENPVDKALKYELNVPVHGPLHQPVASANYHADRFGSAFDFTCEDEVGHSACIALGLERIALALISAHGPRPAAWPASVSAALVAGD
jgi:seryl-tRNA synthetase